MCTNCKLNAPFTNRLACLHDICFFMSQKVKCTVIFYQLKLLKTYLNENPLSQKLKDLTYFQCCLQFQKSITHCWFLEVPSDAISGTTIEVYAIARYDIKYNVLLSLQLIHFFERKRDLEILYSQRIGESHPWSHLCDMICAR